MQGLGRVLARVGAGVLGLLLAIALLSFHPNDPHLFAQGPVGDSIHNWCGSAGAVAAGLLQMLAGWGALLVPIYIVWEAWPKPGVVWPRRLAWVGLAFGTWAFLGALRTYTWSSGPGVQPQELRWGGWLGAALWPSLRRVLGPVGLPIVLGLLILLCLVVLAPALMRALGRLMVRFFGEKAWPFLRPLPNKGFQGFLSMVRHPFLTLKQAPVEPAPDLAPGDFAELPAPSEAARQAAEQREAFARAEREDAEFRRKFGARADQAGLPTIQSMRLPDLPEESGLASVPLAAVPARSERLASGQLQTLPPSQVVLEVDEDDGPDSLRLDPSERPAPHLLRDLPPPPPPKTPLVQPKVTRDKYGRVMEQQALALTEPTPRQPLPTPRELPPMPEPAAHEEALSPVDRHELPPRRLFDPPTEHQKLDPAILQQTRELIGIKLTEFKVKGAVVGLQPGPVVTVYEFAPDAGVPLAKVMGMEDDLALALQAEAVRIDRIPGRNLVGIEVPNPKREVITFREVIDSPAFRDPQHKDGGSLLTMALGKDISGVPVVADLAKMPHLLIGGSTGSGKSVGVNAMICSILLRALPSEVKLILVDPKMVEMGIYEDIPHLWAPVVTDMKEAGRVLKWVVAQMEDRYRRLALLAVRNLEGFNAKVRDAGGMIDLSDRTPNPRWPDRPTMLEPLPYVVVVIDELADLMMVARSEVEESIARIAQKARAVGIHLVLATQRPSVDIVTGVIKANLPSRLSYRVNTKIDSRTILDGSGGEQLLGKGDGLFLAPGTSRPRRIHAPFLSEEETLRLVNWLKERGRPDFNQALMRAMETEEEATPEGGDEGGASGDDIYDRAVAVVKRERKASTSLLQRKLNLGYGRAARLIDRMEEEGIVGPDRGAGKPREVLVEE